MTMKHDEALPADTKIDLNQSFKKESKKSHQSDLIPSPMKSMQRAYSSTGTRSDIR